MQLSPEISAISPSRGAKIRRYQRRRQELRTCDTSTLQRSKLPPAKGLNIVESQQKLTLFILKTSET